MQPDLHYPRGEYRFPPKTIERFCYCVNLQTKHDYKFQVETDDGDAYVYNCDGCDNARVIEGGELEAELKELNK